jgi:hypothetical protein
MDNLEKNYERTVDKAVNAVDKVGKAANRLYMGCITILANMFFAAFCLWGVYAGYTSWQLQTDGETTTGIVVELKEQSDAEGGCCTYLPVVEYSVNDQKYSIDGGTASDPPQYEVGEEVPILYDPSSPSRAQINKTMERWLFPVIIIPAMIFAALAVNFFMWRAWRRGDMVIDE